VCAAPTFDSLSDKYASLWDSATLRPANVPEVTNEVAKLLALKTDYQTVEASTGTPWYVVGLIHYREASFKRDRHLHNGDPLSGRTTHVPAGHPKTGNPPFRWTDSAIDALKLKGFHEVSTWTVERIAYQLELYNGWGYRSRGINSPYLWSYTNHYTKGYFVADHEFDSSAVNRQAGGMALLKKLVEDGAATVSRQSGASAAPPLPPAVPVETGLFLPDGAAFKLADAPAEGANLGFRVTVTMPVRRIKEVDSIWWEVEATDPALQKHRGFTKNAWLKAMTVMSRFDEGLFAQACLSEARAQGSSAHFVIALADAESGMQNILCEGTGGRFGPLALTEGDWSANNDQAQTGFGDAGRFEPDAQAAVGTALVVKLTSEVKELLPDKRLPTSEELYVARVLGAKGLMPVLAVKEADAPTKTVRDALTPTYTSEQLDAIFALRPSLLTAGITVKQVLDAVKAKLKAGFEKAVALILKVEPDFVLGPQEATDTAEVPWIQKAKIELAKPVEEIPGAASNPEIEKYFTDTTLGRQPDDVSWCAAFVSWCLKESGRTGITFSARAADWLKNGANVAGPEFGAVAVTKPYAATSSGHVGFVVHWDGTHVTLLGGNQRNAAGRDAVCEKPFPIADVRGWRKM
jgi:uncharacterized protein (TIGR02594 family)